LFQKIDAGASGLIVTMTMGPKPAGLPVLQGSALSPSPALRDERARLAATRHPPKFNLSGPSASYQT
jgi:hypothetical protein